ALPTGPPRRLPRFALRRRRPTRAGPDGGAQPLGRGRARGSVAGPRGRAGGADVGRGGRGLRGAAAGTPQRAARSPDADAAAGGVAPARGPRHHRARPGRGGPRRWARPRRGGAPPHPPRGGAGASAGPAHPRGRGQSDGRGDPRPLRPGSLPPAGRAGGPRPARPGADRDGGARGHGRDFPRRRLRGSRETPLHRPRRAAGRRPGFLQARRHGARIRRSRLRPPARAGERHAGAEPVRLARHQGGRAAGRRGALLRGREAPAPAADAGRGGGGHGAARPLRREDRAAGQPSGARARGHPARQRRAATRRRAGRPRARATAAPL
ncbi:MAG: hypothetical protein AVDCRST_MAG04-2107, partial [uncultured Acetobacteraceae bacterium]